MPLLEFICPKCNLSWSFRTPSISDVHNNKLCKRCGTLVSRQGIPSSVAIQRTGTSSATTDHIVGQDASTRWNAFQEKKEERDSVRKDLGTYAISQNSDGSYGAVTSQKLEDRKQAYKSIDV